VQVDVCSILFLSVTIKLMLWCIIAAYFPLLGLGYKVLWPGSSSSWCHWW